MDLLERCQEQARRAVRARGWTSAVADDAANAATAVFYNEIQALREQQRGAVSTCPVCQGRGTVPFGFYLTQTGEILSSGTGVETCRSCKGAGYVPPTERSAA